MRTVVRYVATLVFLAWFVWVYGSWAGLLPNDLFTPGPIGTAIALFVTPIVCVLLIGFSKGHMSGRVLSQAAVTSPREPWSWQRVLREFIEMAPGAWFFVAFAAMFFTDRYPFLDAFVWWTFAIWAAVFVAGVAGFILLSIGYSAREAFRMYREAMEIGRVGVSGRILWAIVFVVGFIWAVFLWL